MSQFDRENNEVIALGISRPRMYQLMKVKGFPTVRVGRRLLVSRKGLERWVEEQSKIGWNPQDL